MVDLANLRLKRMILEVLDNQIRENNPAITKITLDRLKRSGYTEQAAKEKIAAVLIAEIYTILKNKENFNEEQYRERLSALQ
jgi:hypothetical protein